MWHSRTCCDGEGVSQSCRKLAIRWNAWSVAPLFLVSAVLLTPYFLSNHILPLGVGFGRGFALVCHQRPDRCFWIFGAPLAVCTRCFGIYVGAAIGLLLRTAERFAFRLLVLAFSINLLDGLAEAFGLHGNWNAFRFVLGLLLGASAGILLSSVQSSRTTASASLVPAG
jgi:uncharacterized membrane protein